MAKKVNKKKVSRQPKPIKIAALIVSAIQDLKETKGSTPKKIAGYITYGSQLPQTKIKRQVNAALKRGVQYGILQRYRGHYFLPSGDELERANKIARRFARLPSPEPNEPIPTIPNILPTEKLLSLKVKGRRVKRATRPKRLRKPVRWNAKKKKTMKSNSLSVPTSLNTRLRCADDRFSLKSAN